MVKLGEIMFMPRVNKIGQQRGLTYLEVAAVVAILGVLVTLAVPSFKEMSERNRLKGAMELLRANFQWARSEAIKTNTQMTLSLKEGIDWCYGFSNAGVCDCGQPNDCQQTFDDLEFDGISLAANGFPVDFSAIGTVETPGNLTLTHVDTDQVVISQMNLLGELRVCSDDLNAYPSC